MSRIAELQRQLAEQQAASEAARQESPSAPSSGRKVNAFASTLAASFNPMMMMPGAKAPGGRPSQGGGDGDSSSSTEDQKQDGQPPAEITHVQKARSSGSRRPATRPSFKGTHAAPSVPGDDAAPETAGAEAASDDRSPLAIDHAANGHKSPNFLGLPMTRHSTAGDLSPSMNSRTFDDLPNPLDDIGSGDDAHSNGAQENHQQQQGMAQAIQARLAAAAVSPRSAYVAAAPVSPQSNREAANHREADESFTNASAPTSPGVGGSVASIGDSLSEAKHPIATQANTSTLLTGHAASSASSTPLKPVSKAVSPPSSRKHSVSLSVSDSLQLSDDDSDLDLGSDHDEDSKQQKSPSQVKRKRAEVAPPTVVEPAESKGAAADVTAAKSAPETPKAVTQPAGYNPAPAQPATTAHTSTAAAAAAPAASTTATSHPSTGDHELDQLLGGDNLDAFDVDDVDDDFEISQVAPRPADGDQQPAGRHDDPVSVSVSGARQGEDEHEPTLDEHDNGGDRAAAAASAASDVDHLLDEFAPVGTDEVAAAMADDDFTYVGGSSMRTGSTGGGIVPSLHPLLPVEPPTAEEIAAEEEERRHAAQHAELERELAAVSQKLNYLPVLTASEIEALEANRLRVQRMEVEGKKHEIKADLEKLRAGQVPGEKEEQAEANGGGEDEEEVEEEEVVEEVEVEEVEEEEGGDPSDGAAPGPHLSWHAQAAARARALLAPPPPGMTKNAGIGVKVAKAREAKKLAVKESILAQAKALAPQVTGPSKVHEPTAAVLAAKKEFDQRVTPAMKAQAKKAADAAYAARFASGQFEPTKTKEFRADAPTQAAVMKKKKKGESWSLDESAAAQIRAWDFGAPPPKEERPESKKLSAVAQMDPDNLPHFASPKKQPKSAPDAAAAPGDSATTPSSTSRKKSKLPLRLTPSLPLSSAQLAETSARLSSPRSQKKKVADVQQEEQAAAAAERKRAQSAKKKKVVVPNESEVALVASLTRPTTAASGRVTKKVATGTGPTGFGGGEAAQRFSTTRPPASARGPTKATATASASAPAAAKPAAAARPQSARASLGVASGGVANRASLGATAGRSAVAGKESKIPASPAATARKSTTPSAASASASGRASLGAVKPARPSTAHPTTGARATGELKSKTPTTSRKKKEETITAAVAEPTAAKSRSSSAKKASTPKPATPSAASPSKLRAPTAVARPASARASVGGAAKPTMAKPASAAAAKPVAKPAAIKPVSAKPTTAAKPVKAAAAKPAAPAAAAASAPSADVSPVKSKRLSVSAASSAPAPVAAQPPVGAVLKSKKQIAHEAALLASATAGGESGAPAADAATTAPVDAAVSGSVAPESSLSVAVELDPEEEQERRVAEIRKAKLASKVKMAPIGSGGGEKVTSTPAASTTPVSAPVDATIADPATEVAAVTEAATSAAPAAAAAAAAAAVVEEGFHTAYAPKSAVKDGLAVVSAASSPTSVSSSSKARSAISSPSSLSTGKPSHARSNSASSVRRVKFAHERLLMELEEVFDWLGKVVDGSNIQVTSPVNPDALFGAIENGAVLCGLVQKCQQIAQAKNDLQLVGACKPISFKLDARSGSFVARDNLANFLSAMSAWGMPKAQLFEVDDLVVRKNDKQVIQSLLDVSRMCFAKFGIAPPQLVQFEMDIEQEEAEPEQPAMDEPTMPELPPTPTEAVEPADPAKPPPPRYLPYIPIPSDPLDVAVGQFINGKAIDIWIKRAKSGAYFIGDVRDPKVHRVRLVRHLILVRVGGGWESFTEMAQRKFDAQATEEAKVVQQVAMSAPNSPPAVTVPAAAAAPATTTTQDDPLPDDLDEY